MERFPERCDAIMALNQTNERFQDLITDHHEVSAELDKMQPAERASDPARRETLERRRADLEVNCCSSWCNISGFEWLPKQRSASAWSDVDQ